MKLEICWHCGLPVKYRKINAVCDHLHYPENCEICKSKDYDLRTHIYK